MTRNVVGVDPSLTSTGISVIAETGELVGSHRIKTEATGKLVQHRMDRLTILLSRFAQIVGAAKPEAVCIEAYSFGSSGGQAWDRIELGGMLRYWCHNNGFKMFEVAPSRLKKWACGNGAAEGKIPIVNALNKRYGVQFNTSDEYDAYALGRMAFQLVGFSVAGEEIPKYQQEAIDAILNPEPKKTSKRKKAES